MDAASNVHSQSTAPWVAGTGTQTHKGHQAQQERAWMQQALVTESIQWLTNSFRFQRSLYPGFFLGSKDTQALISLEPVIADLEGNGFTPYIVTGEIIDRQAQFLWEQASQKTTFGKPLASKLELDLWGNDLVLIDGLNVPESYPQLWYLYNQVLYPRFLTGKATIVSSKVGLQDFLRTGANLHQSPLAQRREITWEKLTWLMEATLIDLEQLKVLRELELLPMLKAEYALFNALRQRGLEPSCQRSIGNVLVDLSLVEGRTKLGIQCNGIATLSNYKHQTAEAQINNLLFSQGWQMLRFSSGEVLRRTADCAEAIEEVFRGGSKKSIMGRYVGQQQQKPAINLPDDDEIQTAAITQGGGPAAIAGGAGSGKTTCIARRAAYLINQGIHPDRILVVLRAAGAIDGPARIIDETLSRQETQGLNFFTWQELGAKIVKENAALIQRKSPLKVESNPQKIIAKVLAKQRKNMDPLALDLTSALDEFALVSLFSRCKSNLVTPQELKDQAKDETDALIARVFQGYEDELRKSNRIDSDDRISRAAHLLLEHAEVRQKYQGQYEFVLVDEYQDATIAQDVLLRMLASPQDNFMVAGEADEALDQSKSAHPALFTDLSFRLPQISCFQLEKNWRLQPGMLRCAQRIISRLPDQHEHKLGVSMRGANTTSIQVTQKLADENAEANWAAQQIKTLLDGGRSAANIAVLYRHHAYAMLLEENLSGLGIHCAVQYPEAQLVPNETEDMLAFLKLVMDPDGPKAKEAFERICQLRVKEVDPKLSGIITAFAAQNNLSYLKAVEIYSEATADQSCRELEQLVRIIRTMHQEKLPPSEAISLIRRTQRLNDYYRSVRVPVGVNYEPLRKLNRLEELAQKFSSVEGFVQDQLALRDKTDENLDVAGVSVLALPDARGAEFPIVFLVGLADGIFPSGATLDANEERRLCYVAFTRASETLYTSYPEKFNGLQVKPSPFLVDAGLVAADPHAKLSTPKAPANYAIGQTASTSTSAAGRVQTLPSSAAETGKVQTQSTHTLDSVRQCLNCKSRLEPQAQFCGECGTRVGDENAVRQSQASSDISTCATCRSLLEPSARFCGECGTPVQAPIVSGQL